MITGSEADAVVIGAGHNGLVAANLLADAGWSVVVCEATPHIGGAVRTAEVTAAGYHTDLFSPFYPLSVASPIVSALRLEDYGLRWRHAPAVLAHVFPDDRCAVLYRDRQRTAESLAIFHPDDGGAWLHLVDQWDEIARPLLDALFTPFPPILPTQRLLWSLGISGLLRFARMAVQPVRRFGEETFRGAGGPMLLAGNALHADLPPDGAGRAMYGWLLCMLGQSYGFPVPIGGAGRLADALAARLRARGGVVRLDAPVTQIVLAHGRASGVQLASGEKLAVGRAVIADVTAPQLYFGLIGEDRLPRQLVTDLRKFQWDAPTLKINWALSRPVPRTAEPARLAGTVHLGVDLNGLTDYAADLATRRIPRRPFLLMGQMTTSDPTRSPAGTESAWAYTHVPAGIDLSDGRLKPMSNSSIGSSNGTLQDSCNSSWVATHKARPTYKPLIQTWYPAPSTVAPRSCISSSSFARSQASAERRRRSTGSISAARRRTLEGVCTGDQAPMLRTSRSRAPASPAGPAAQ